MPRLWRLRSSILQAPAAALVVAAGLVACVNVPDGGTAASGRTDPADLPQGAGEWPSYGRDWSEQRFSPLKQITADNVGRLGLAWSGDLQEKGGSYETTPVVVDGRIFVTSPWSSQLPRQHAANGRAVSSLFPDLRYSGQLWTTDGLKAVVISGALPPPGAPRGPGGAPH
jgi:glucose dehydrogenase